MANPPHVLILGGGFVAHQVIRALRRPTRRGEIAATVVDRDNFVTFHGLIGEMVSGRVPPSNILNPARRGVRARPGACGRDRDDRHR